jgi:acetyl-CoA acetyltransferase
MSQAYLLGSFCTPFGRFASKNHLALAREALDGVLNDAGLSDGQKIGKAYFGSVLMHMVGQTMIRGQTCLLPLMEEGLLPERLPIVNVEGACATGSIALNLARKEILAGEEDLVLAIGVEKMHEPEDPGRVLGFIEGGLDQFGRERWMREYGGIARTIGGSWDPKPGRSIAMDTYALQAQEHMHRWGTTAHQIACAAAKNHNHGSLNPNAQYRFRMTPDEVLNDRMVSAPLTRAMCAPTGDGAAAALVCSERFLKQQPKAVQSRAVRILASAIAGGKFRMPGETGLSRVAADKAYAAAGVGPQDIDFAEVHDATSFCELFQVEMLRFCEPGQGGSFVASGATTLGGEKPVNVSGGLVSKGHPIAATGLSMVNELCTQLRAEAGDRQVPDAKLGLAENGGGVLGLEEAVCSVVILGRAQA